MENELKHDILTVVSMGVMVKRRALNMLHPSPKYVEKCVSEMYADKLIRRAPHRIVRLGQEARTELAEDEWNLYLALSNNDAPGCDKLHVDAYVRASDFLCMAYAAGITAQFYRVPLIRTKSPELTDGSDRSVAVLRRDLKIKGQKQQRMNGTRASGYIYSPGFCGTVTATNGRNLRVSRSGERQEALICSAERAYLTSKHRYTNTRRCSSPRPTTRCCICFSNGICRIRSLLLYMISTARGRSSATSPPTLTVCAGSGSSLRTQRRISSTNSLRRSRYRLLRCTGATRWLARCRLWSSSAVTCPSCCGSPATRRLA